MMKIFYAIIGSSGVIAFFAFIVLFAVLIAALAAIPTH